MSKRYRAYPLRWMIWTLFACSLLAGAGKAHGADAAAALLAKYQQLEQQLNHNQFKRPLYLESEESSNYLKGDIYARVDYPFGLVSSALKEPAQWCDILILHINIKYCRASAGADGDSLTVRIGKKDYQSLDQAHRVDFSYHVAAATPRYFEVGLDAEKGPLSTRDYRIVLQAIPISDKQTFLHMTYSYAYGMLGQMAMHGYLATAGRNKVGFTSVKERPDGPSQYVGGMRGVVERNTMRYYLAIDAYLSALATPASQQFEKRLRNWFNATEQYSTQLHEMDASTYLDMKRHEYARQQQTTP